MLASLVVGPLKLPSEGLVELCFLARRLKVAKVISVLLFLPQDAQSPEALQLLWCQLVTKLHVPWCRTSVA